MIETRQLLPDSNQKDAYDDLYSNQGIHQLDSFYMWILGILRPVPGRVLLDVSCGEGQLVYWAVRKGVSAHGVDISQKAVEKAMTKTPEATLQVGNGEALPYPDESFDYVTNIGSIEHYDDMAAGIREISRVMNVDARACILLPNIYGLLWQVRAVWRTGDISDDGQPIQRYGTINHWRRLLEENGLKVDRVYKYDYEFPRTFGDLLKTLRHPKRMAYLVLSLFVPFNLANNFVFLCEKK